MKEKLHTIPLADAFKANDECPFCFVERKLEEHTMDFVLGSGASYMEDDIRAETDKAGFCRMHYKKMYEYGNRLGTGLILKTHFQKLNQEFEEQMRSFAPGKTSLMSRFKKKDPNETSRTSLGAWVMAKEDSCYICNFYKDTFQRYMETFFDMYKKDADLRELFKNSKGYCIPHFGDLAEAADKVLSDKDKKEFFDVLLPLMKSNLQRLYEDLDWFCDKFDYRFKDADWKTSKDALERGMQKAAGGYPADPPYTADR
ncbi:MAG: hypothetical protein KBT01_01140 [Clostridiales bacterium]|nr:hypothetical protein [Candidatus Blautia equi]